MTTPPHKLVEHLWHRESIMLVGGGAPRHISATEAMHLAELGLIEGVGPRSGAIKHLRWLAPNARPDPLCMHRRQPDTVSLDDPAVSGSTAFARTNMGVYCQPMRQVFVGRDAHDSVIVTGEGDITGHCYAFCALRAVGGDKESPLAGL